MHTVAKRRMASVAGMIVMAAMLEHLSVSASAHKADSGWTYPPACCHGDPMTGECSSIPGTTVTPTPDGYVIILRPGDHRRVTHQDRYFVPYDSVIPSGDDDFHICLHPTEEHENCFFAPAETM
ncbi:MULTISPECIES: hypothetical protein [unclassified Mesorhizobium]|uniref:hypothetical protein n=1 Tax=unclassified Mesorhizobium TaxID=325217 RepID=UPI001FDFF866|nr:MULTISPECIES: hypothetical protein [unclassified Mesorhizobium]